MWFNLYLGLGEVRRVQGGALSTAWPSTFDLVVCKLIRASWRNHMLRSLDEYHKCLHRDHSLVHRDKTNHGGRRLAVWTRVTDTGSADGLRRGGGNRHAPLPGMHGHRRRDGARRRRTPSFARCLRIWARRHDLHSGKCDNLRIISGLCTKECRQAASTIVATERSLLSVVT